MVWFAHDGTWKVTSLSLPGSTRFFILFSHFLPVLLKKAIENAAGWASGSQTRPTHHTFTMFFPRNLILRSEGEIKEEQFQEKPTASLKLFSPAPSQQNFTNSKNLLMKKMVTLQCKADIS